MIIRLRVCPTGCCRSVQVTRTGEVAAVRWGRPGRGPPRCGGDERGRAAVEQGDAAEGIAGITRLHAMIAAQLDPGADLDTQAGQVLIGIETDRGPWVQALIAAGYQVYAVNPSQAARYRERHSVSGAESDPADGHLWADMVRTDSHQLRVVAGDSELAEAVKVVTRARKTLTWGTDPARPAAAQYVAGVLSAALVAFEDLTAPDTLELPGKARPSQCGPVDHHPDHRRAQAGPPSSPRPAGRRDPGRAAHPQLGRPAVVGARSSGRGHVHPVGRVSRAGCGGHRCSRGREPSAQHPSSATFEGRPGRKSSPAGR